MKLKVIAALTLVVMAVAGAIAMPNMAMAAECPEGTLNYGKGDMPIAECNIDRDKTTTDLMTTVSTIINVVLGIVALVAVVVIILGGIGFVTSQGEAGKVTKARNTILYGVIGLVIALLAFPIVNFALRGAFETNKGTSEETESQGGGGGGGGNVDDGAGGRRNTEFVQTMLN